MLRGKLFLISVAVLFQAVSISSGDLLLDQSNDNDRFFTLGFGTWEGNWAWQQFRPTMNNLQQVEIFLDNWNVPEGKVVFFEVQEDDGTTLWNTSFSADIIPENNWLILDTPYISLVPEETYRLCLTTNILQGETSTFDVIWLGTESGNLYNRGDSWQESNFPGFDYGFRTWAVPEPATLLLLGLGVVMLRKKDKFSLKIS